MITMATHRPVQPTILNAGRKPHEFTSRLFHVRHVIITAIEPPGGLSPPQVVQIKEGPHAQLALLAPMGTYSVRCRIGGHEGCASDYRWGKRVDGGAMRGKG